MKKTFTLKFKLLFTCLMFIQFMNAQTGASLHFDGVNDNVRVPLINFSGGNMMTVEAWIKPSNITSNTYYEISRQENSPFPDWLLSFQNNGTILSFGLKTTTGYTELDVAIIASNFTNGIWHHVAATYNGNIKYLYVDGVQIGSEIKTGNITFTGFGHYIGSQAGVNEFFNGEIDEVRYWNLARTACERNTFKNIEIPNFYSGLIGNYHFNQGIAAANNTTVTTLTDAAGSVGTGTLIGFGLSSGTVSNWVGATAPLAKVVGPAALCSGSSAIYSVMPIPNSTIYNWSIPGSWSGSSTTNTILLTAGVGGGGINVVASGTCTTTAPIIMSVSITPAPTITAASSNTLLCVGQSATLTASGASTYTWNPGGGTGASITVSPTSSTSYTVTGTSTLGCNNSSSIIQNVSLCIGINEMVVESSEISIYPNPTTGILNVKAPEGSVIEVYNVIGKKIASTPFSFTKGEPVQSVAEGGMRLDLSQQPSGIYFVKIGSVTKKIIKE